MYLSQPLVLSTAAVGNSLQTSATHTLKPAKKREKPFLKTARVWGLAGSSAGGEEVRAASSEDALLEPPPRRGISQVLFFVAARDERVQAAFLWWCIWLV